MDDNPSAWTDLVSLNRLMAKGAAWMVGLRLFHRMIGFVSTLILARLLTPEDFGLVAMATVLFAMLVAVSDFSVHVPLIQKSEIDRADMDSAWSLQVLVGLSQAILLLALAKPAAAFYGEPRLVPVIWLLAGIAMLKGAKNIGVVMFQREMRFHRDFVLMATQRLSMFFATLTAALIWRSYWALLLGMAVGAMVEFGLSYLMHPHRPKPCRSRWGEIIRFSRWMLANNFMNFLGRRGPDLVLGRLIGAKAVGLFSVSYEIAMLPTTELIAPINRAALPGYSRMRETEGALQRGYLDVAGLIALVGLPAALGIAAGSEVLIPLLLGSQWMEAIPVVHHLALAGGIAVLLTNTGAVMMAIGKPWLITMQLLVRIALLVPGIYLGAMTAGVPGVALAYLLVAVVMLFVNLGLVLSVLQIRVRDYIAAVCRPVMAGTFMYALLAGLLVPQLSEIWNMTLLPASLGTVGAGAALYTGGVIGLWCLAGRPRGAEARFLQIAGEVLEARMPQVGRWLRTQT